MSHGDFTKQHRMLGRFAAFAVFADLLAYVPVLVLGLLSLKSPLEPIGDPYFSVLESLIVVLAPLMVMVMVAVHAYAPPRGQSVQSYGSHIHDFAGGYYF